MPKGVEAFFFEECDSTNTRASEFARAGKKGPLWIVAGAQSKGRGRRGRDWESQQGNLYASLLFRPPVQANDLAALPFIAALSVRDTFVHLGAQADCVACKWPNDILIEGKKAAGILIESSALPGGKLDYVIIGIGMNLLHFPEGAAFAATSLYAATDKKVTAKEALCRLATTLEQRLTNWDINNFSPISAEWTKRSWGLGEFRQIREHTDTYDALLVGLSNEGALIARLDDGTEKHIYAGDVFPVLEAE